MRRGKIQKLVNSIKFFYDQSYFFNITKFLLLFSARFRQKRYNHIISLGYNCEVAFRFFRNYRFVDSSLFNWAISRLDDLIYTLEHYDEILSGGITTSHLHICSNTKIQFHGKTPLDLISQNGKILDQELLNEDIVELKNRVEYLKKKFIKNLNDETNMLFIIKIASLNLDIELIKKIKKLKNSLKKLGNNTFDFLLIVEKKYYESFKYRNELEKLAYVRTVRRFSSDSAVTGSKEGDQISWKIIFAEFYPSRKLKKQTNFKFEQ